MLRERLSILTGFVEPDEMIEVLQGVVKNPVPKLESQGANSC